MARLLTDKIAGAGRAGLPPFLALAVFFLLLPVALAGWPVDILEIRLAGEDLLVFSAPAPMGGTFSTRMLHSVQLTPVVDVYRPAQGHIWGWREFIRSHNAGLPSLEPERGRFYQTAEWMVVEGGGASWPLLAYRVGNSALGKNEFTSPAGEKSELWRICPGQLLHISTRKAPLLSAARVYFPGAARAD